MAADIARLDDRGRLGRCQDVLLLGLRRHLILRGLLLLLLCCVILLPHSICVFIWRVARRILKINLFCCCWWSIHDIATATELILYLVDGA